MGRRGEGWVGVRVGRQGCQEGVKGEGGETPAGFPPLCTGDCVASIIMATDFLRRLGRPRSDALEPGVRKPCLLLDGSDHIRSGKGRVASSAEISVRAPPDFGSPSIT